MQKEKYFFCDNVFNYSYAAEASESVYMWEKVNMRLKCKLKTRNSICINFMLVPYYRRPKWTFYKTLMWLLNFQSVRLTSFLQVVMAALLGTQGCRVSIMTDWLVLG